MAPLPLLFKLKWFVIPVSDSYLVTGGGANRPVGGGGGGRMQNCQMFPKKCMKLRKFRAVGGVLAPCAP